MVVWACPCPWVSWPCGFLVTGSILAIATLPNAIDSANMSAVTNNEMRLRIRFLSSLIVFHPIASPR